MLQIIIEESTDGWDLYNVYHKQVGSKSRTLVADGVHSDNAARIAEELLEMREKAARQEE